MNFSRLISHCSTDFAGVLSHLDELCGMRHFLRDLDFFLVEDANRFSVSRRFNFLFSPHTDLCAVTYITDISLHMTLNNQSHSYSLAFIEAMLDSSDLVSFLQLALGLL